MSDDAKLKREGDLEPGGIERLAWDVVERAFTGVVEVTVGSLDAAIVFQDGALVDARFREARGEPAVFRVLAIPRGRFRIKARGASSIPPVQPLGTLEELWPRFEKRRELLELRAQMLGGLGQRWSVRFAVLRFLLESFPPQIRPLIKLLDGTRSVGQVMAESPLEEEITLRVLSKLLAQGALEVEMAGLKAPAPRASAPVEPTPVASAPSEKAAEPEPDPEPAVEAEREPEPEPRAQDEAKFPPISADEVKEISAVHDWAEAEAAASLDDVELEMWLGRDTGEVQSAPAMRPTWIAYAGLIGFGVLVLTLIALVISVIAHEDPRPTADPKPAGINARE